MGDIGEIYGGGFDTDSAPPSEGFDPIPAGWYTAAVENAEIKTNKAKTGQYLKIEFVIVGPEHENRRVFNNITLTNPNQTAVEIGQRDLCGLAKACLIGPMLTDSSELLGKIIQIRVKIGKAKEGYDPENEVVAYKPIEAAGTPGGASAAAQGQAAQQPQPQQQNQAQMITNPQSTLQQQTAAMQAKRPWEK